MTAAMISTNIFDYATSELSQDAFICWICSQFNSNDNVLRESSQNLLHAFLGADKESTPVTVLNISKQCDHIDVLLLAEYEGRNYAIVVEDKVFSVEHDDQLNRYRESIGKVYGEGTPDVIRVVYFKTGTMSERSAIQNSCDVILGRQEILNCLVAPRQSDSSGDSIFADYVGFLMRRNSSYEAYRSLPVSEWSDDQFCGFFEYLQSKLKGRGYWSGYGDNNNRNGGHWTLWFGNEKQVGSGKWGFQVNVESPNRHSDTSWSLRALVRWNGDDEHSYSRSNFDLPEINDTKYRRGPGKHTIMGELMSISKSGIQSDWNYEQVEEAIFAAANEYEAWCDANRSE